MGFCIISVISTVFRGDRRSGAKPPVVLWGRVLSASARELSPSDDYCGLYQASLSLVLSP